MITLDSVTALLQQTMSAKTEIQLFFSLGSINWLNIYQKCTSSPIQG